MMSQQWSGQPMATRGQHDFPHMPQREDLLGPYRVQGGRLYYTNDIEVFLPPNTLLQSFIFPGAGAVSRALVTVELDDATTFASSLPLSLARPGHLVLTVVPGDTVYVRVSRWFRPIVSEETAPPAPGVLEWASWTNNEFVASPFVITPDVVMAVVTMNFNSPASAPTGTNITVTPLFTDSELGSDIIGAPPVLTSGEWFFNASIVTVTNPLLAASVSIPTPNNTMTGTVFNGETATLDSVDYAFDTDTAIINSSSTTFETDFTQSLTIVPGPKELTHYWGAALGAHSLRTGSVATFDGVAHNAVPEYRSAKIDDVDMPSLLHARLTRLGVVPSSQQAGVLLMTIRLRLT